jgi:hypothetical protein
VVQSQTASAGKAFGFYEVKLEHGGSVSFIVLEFCFTFYKDLLL